ncbi:unnamed protein product [Rangifer tarandus platyrhynchus]|uniref:Uncharacterized protein n=1 Tax=Rangifer tarandus platyrhynchus TaxID=3082113 RepID=A0ABN8YH63_RANTA|nr:unnamed protein product [Rangifer tarandus platyrhynchus]
MDEGHKVPTAWSLQGTCTTPAPRSACPELWLGRTLPGSPVPSQLPLRCLGFLAFLWQRRLAEPRVPPPDHPGKLWRLHPGQERQERAGAPRPSSGPSQSPPRRPGRAPLGSAGAQVRTVLDCFPEKAAPGTAPSEPPAPARLPLGSQQLLLLLRLRDSQGSASLDEGSLGNLPRWGRRPDTAGLPGPTSPPGDAPLATLQAPRNLERF